MINKETVIVRTKALAWQWLSQLINHNLQTDGCMNRVKNTKKCHQLCLMSWCRLASFRQENLQNFKRPFTYLSRPIPAISYHGTAWHISCFWHHTNKSSHLGLNDFEQLKFRNFQGPLTSNFKIFKTRSNLVYNNYPGSRQEKTSFKNSHENLWPPCKCVLSTDTNGTKYLKQASGGKNTVLPEDVQSMQEVSTITDTGH